MLRGYDEQIRDRLLQISMTKGIAFRFNAPFEKVVKNDDGSLNVHMKGCEPVTCDALLFATGRRPKTDGLGLETDGVELDDTGRTDGRRDVRGKRGSGLVEQGGGRYSRKK